MLLWIESFLLANVIFTEISVITNRGRAATQVLSRDHRTPCLVPIYIYIFDLYVPYVTNILLPTYEIYYTEHDTVYSVNRPLYTRVYNYNTAVDNIPRDYRVCRKVLGTSSGGVVSS